MLIQPARLPIRFGLLSIIFVFLLIGCNTADERAQSYYESGVELLAKGDPVKASLEFRNALKLKQDFVPALYSLGDAEQRQGHFDSAAQLYYNVTQLATDNVDARVGLANILLLAGKLDDAKKYADQAYALTATDPRVLAIKAAVSLRLDNRGDAVRFANAALKADANNVDALMVLASERLLASDPKGALAFLDKAPKEREDDLGLQVFRMKVLGSLGDKDGIEQVFKRLAERHPNEASIHDGLAQWYLANGRPADAERVMREYASGNPDDKQAALRLVAFLRKQKGDDAARQELQSLIEKGGDVFSYRLALGELAFAGQDYQEGVKQMRALIADTTDTDNRSKARIQLARAMAANKDMKEAEELVSSVLEEDPKNADALAVRASIHLLDGRVNDAIDDLRTALNEAPQSAPLLMLLAQAYDQNGTTELAEEQYAKAVTAAKFEPAVGLPYVRFLLRYGNIDKAERVLTDIRAAAPNNRDVLTLFAQVKLSKQDWTGAQEIAGALRKLDGEGDKLSADQILAAALGGQKKYDEAVSVLQDAAATSGDDTSSMASLVGAYVQAGQTDKAKQFLTSVLQTSPSNVQALILLASVQAEDKQLDEAEATLNQAVASDSGGVIGNRALAEFYLRSGRFKEAVDAAGAALSHKQDDPSLHLLLATTLQVSKQYDQAIDEYEHMFAADPRAPIVANNLASLLADHRSDAQSLDRALEIASRFQQTDIPQYQDTLGWIYYLKGDYPKALTLLKSAAEKLPKMTAVQYHLGMAYKALGETELATTNLAIGPFAREGARVCRGH